MRTLVISSATAVLAAIFSVGGAVSDAAELKPGDEAPAFTLQASDGKTYSLADFQGKQAVVLAWFPKAFTPGCTKECKSFGAEDSPLKKYDVAYFTASCDTPDENARFAQSLGVDFPILADPAKEVARAYGVVDDQRKVARRWTFFIGKDGKILAIDKAVVTSSHAADVAEKLDELGVPKK